MKMEIVNYSKRDYKLSLKRRYENTMETVQLNVNNGSEIIT